MRKRKTDRSSELYSVGCEFAIVERELSRTVLLAQIDVVRQFMARS